MSRDELRNILVGYYNNNFGIDEALDRIFEAAR